MDKESLLQKLNYILKTENVVNFSYKKKNGELRHARGTKNLIELSLLMKMQFQQVKVI